MESVPLFAAGSSKAVLCGDVPCQSHESHKISSPSRISRFQFYLEMSGCHCGFWDGGFTQIIGILWSFLTHLGHGHP